MNETITRATYNWVIQHIDDTCINHVHRLKGGISSKMYAITLQSETHTYEVVIRQIDDHSWLEQEPDLIRHEAAALKTAAFSTVATPTVIAYDHTGVHCEVPTLLMTKLPGQIELLPVDFELYTADIASTLSEIHSSKIKSFPYKYSSYSTVADIAIPSWSKQQKKWHDLLSIRCLPAPEETLIFIHRDFHPNNLLFENGKVTGVVDWINACMGPRGVDVGHCRWNLAMMYGVDTANQFLKAYQTVTPEFTYHVYWDVVALFDVVSDPVEVYAGWKQFGLTGITETVLQERMDAYMSSLWDMINNKKEC